MSSLIEEIGRERGDQALAGLWSATIAKDASSTTELVPVVIPAFDEHLAWGPCRWSPRVAVAGDGVRIVAPAKGDAALVAYDDTGDLWIIAWWPA